MFRAKDNLETGATGAGRKEAEQALAEPRPLSAWALDGRAAPRRSQESRVRGASRSGASPGTRRGRLGTIWGGARRVGTGRPEGRPGQSCPEVGRDRGDAADRRAEGQGGALAPGTGQRRVWSSGGRGRRAGSPGPLRPRRTAPTWLSARPLLARAGAALSGGCVAAAHADVPRAPDVLVTPGPPVGVAPMVPTGLAAALRPAGWFGPSAWSSPTARTARAAGSRSHARGRTAGRAVAPPSGSSPRPCGTCGELQRRPRGAGRGARSLWALYLACSSGSREEKILKAEP